MELAATEQAFLAPCGEQADRGGVDHGSLAPIGLGAPQQRGADPLRQQERHGDRQQQLALQAARHQPLHQVGTLMRRTSAASM